MGEEFRHFGSGSAELYLIRDLAAHAGALMSELLRMMAWPAAGEGNRRSGYRLALPGVPELFVRYARRGGLIAPMLLDVHFGLQPRPVSELRVALEAYRRGIAVVEPLGAMVKWLAPLVYRGCFLTSALSGMTLWEFLNHDDEPAVRDHVVAQAAQAIERMHQGGLYHADLNFHNLFVARVGETFSLKILDLDKARLYAAPLAGRLRRKNLARLARSARKLDPERRHLDERLLSQLNLT